jgi:alkylation response protein AidB-like acyl-CoA dehydrogenase
VQFAHSEEQQQIRTSARELLGARAAPAQRRATLREVRGYDPQLWRTLGELGWMGLAIPQEYGGAGLGWVDLCILEEEQGRALLASPFFATSALAAPLIAAGGDEEQRRELLPRVARGEVRLACALTGSEGYPPPAGIGVVLEQSGTELALSGVSDFVIHADAADLLLVLARAPHSTTELSVAVIAASAPGVTIRPHVMLDLTRPMARVELQRVRVARQQVLGEPGRAAAALAVALDLARVALASEALGGAEQVLEMTTAYVKERVQFGRPVGSFQAVKHRLADMMIEVEAARSAAWYAACVADERPEELAEAAAIAKSYCCDAFFDCAANAIQLHGGIGFTWEHDAHLYFKRARAIATLLGSPAWLRERIVRRMASGAAAGPAF